MTVYRLADSKGGKKLLNVGGLANLLRREVEDFSTASRLVEWKFYAQHLPPFNDHLFRVRGRHLTSYHPG